VIRVYDNAGNVIETHEHKAARISRSTRDFWIIRKTWFTGLGIG
jgi:hypothetical protein